MRGIQYMATAAVCEASRPEIRLRSIPDTAPVISDIEQVSIQNHLVTVKLWTPIPKPKYRELGLTL